MWEAADAATCGDTCVHSQAPTLRPVAHLHFFKADGARGFTGKPLRRRIAEAVAELALEAAVAEVGDHAPRQAPGGEANVQEQHCVDQLQLQPV